MAADDKALRRRSPRPRQGERLVKITVMVPAELAQMTKELALARNWSVAALHTEALRVFMRQIERRDDDASGLELLARNISQLDRTQKIVREAVLTIGETLGVMLQLELGTLPMPRTDAEWDAYNKQVAERFPKAVGAIAANVRERAFMKRWLSSTRVEEKDFERSAAEDSAHEQS